MKEPFNSQAPHFLTKVKTYCAKVLPLVFDNSLSYYEFLGKMCHKLNECIDALNAQNLNIIEFTHMVQLEVENFEKYIDTRMTEFENELKTEWAQFKEEMNKAFADFKQQMESEWAAEKALNEKFRNDLLNEFNELKADIIAQQERFENKMKADFNTFKETVNAEIEQFEQTTNADLTAFKNTMQTQQNEFESHMVELFNNFKTTEKQARTEFESNFQQLFEQWKIDTLNALNQNISDWETDTQSGLTEYINGKLAEFNQSLTNAVTALQNAVSNESLARTQADSELQRQINQLTPTGSIKADTPDSDGNSQLYTINPETQERTNIFPKVNDSGGGDLPVNVVTADEKNNSGVSTLYRNNEKILPLGEVSPVYLRPNTDTNESYLQAFRGSRGVMQHFLLATDGTPFVKLKGITDFGNGFIKIPISALGYEIAPNDGTDILGRLQIDFQLYTDGDTSHSIAKAGLRFNLYWARFDGDYWKCGVMCTGFNDTEGVAAVSLAKLITTINIINYN